MATTIEKLNSLVANYTDLKDYFEAQRPRWDDDVAAAEAAYAALSGNLKGVIRSLMDFTGTVDPDIANPTNLDGGTFNDIATLVDAAPYGAFIQAKLAADKTHVLTSLVSLAGKNLMILKEGEGFDPIFEPGSFVSSNQNQCYRFTNLMGGCLTLQNVDIRLPAKADPNLDWNVFYHVLVDSTTAASVDVRLMNCAFSGSDGAAIVTVNRGSIVNLSLWGTSFDGPIFGVTHVGGWGIAHIASQGLTLTNGALAQSGGTLGTDLLQN
ncbi:hypothetical protein [Roseobacter sp. GAI101]|uniref:hypothetical protein n=1 Tax=Roseobacter sp. (strain GAI101) TaxID=391589 RepID=UPI00018718F6|nr:hypothetical protein [Roseobacter sp. GAI101]EEB85155.1 hypothetical protein RGAI101_2305 [Roseobacter sp. GAI101]